MSEIQLRRIPFEFEGVEFLWNPSNPEFSRICNSISWIAVGFEMLLCKKFREAQSSITDPDLKKECDLFIRQEGLHTAAHQKHIDALVARYPGLEELQPKVRAHYQRMMDEHDLEWCICYGATLEGTFTPGGKFVIDHRDVLFGGGDARVATLMLWHLCEEIEHRSTCMKVYRHLYARRWARVPMANWIRLNAGALTQVIYEDFEKHVPEEERRMSGGPVLAELPRWPKILALLRMVMSFGPRHEPGEEPTPDWAPVLLGAHAAGEDIRQYIGRRTDAASTA